MKANFIKQVTMKIQAKDLMIGDWVYIKDHPIKSQPQKVKPEHFVRSLVEFEPIPLTLEILEKNGFKKDEKFEEMYYWNWRIGDDCISYDKETGIVRIFHTYGHLVFVLPLSYVHELQHALRLCGIEKEIEL